ncbi:MAG: 50S ribosome-binding GTPase [Candidatus Diapherotrites archaeon]|nr:50S ribosome-binding GTPase [Candidatus Diapherotrites archaeon]
MNLKFLEKPEQLLDNAFRAGRKEASIYKKQKTPFYTLKGKEITKIDISATYLQETLQKIVEEFPRIEELDSFYRELVECIIDADETRKALSSISSVSKLIKKQKIIAITRLKELNFEKKFESGKGRSGKNRGGEKGSGGWSWNRVKKISNEYFGRTSSLVKGLRKQIEVYNGAAKKMRELPSIRASEESIILAGYPNVGKTTLLGKITESKAKVASYPFTTQGLNIGYLKKKHIPIQIIDTPGLLDRPLNRRNKIEMRAISALRHLNGLVVFIVDPLEDLPAQKNLLLEMKKLFSEKKFLIIINKTDITPEEIRDKTEKELREFLDSIGGKEKIIFEGNGLDNLKNELLSN